MSTCAAIFFARPVVLGGPWVGMCGEQEGQLGFRG